MGQVKGVDGTQSHLQAINFSRAVVFDPAAVTEGMVARGSGECLPRAGALRERRPGRAVLESSQP